MTVSEIGICILDLNFWYLHFLFISLFQAYLQQWHMRKQGCKNGTEFLVGLLETKKSTFLSPQDGIAHTCLVIAVA